MPRKMLTLLLSAALLLSLTGTAFSAAAQEAAGRGETAPAGDNAEVTGEEIAAAPTYTAFLKDHNITDENAAPAAGQAIRLDSGMLAAGTGKFTAGTDSVLLDEEGSLTVAFQGQPGLYNLVIEYDPVAGRSRDVELGVRLGGKLPFQEAGSLVLTRRWRDKGGKLRRISTAPMTPAGPR